MKKIWFKMLLGVLLLTALYIFWEVRKWDGLEKEFRLSYEGANYSRSLEIARSQYSAAQGILFLNRYYVPPSLNNIGKSYHAEGSLGEAEYYYKLALDMSEKTLGPDNPRLLILLENLEKLYREKSDPAEADKYSQRVKRLRAPGQ